MLYVVWLFMRLVVYVLICVMVLDTIPILGITRTDDVLYVVWLFMRLVVDVLI